MLILAKILGFGKSVVGWSGFRSWQFWVGAAFSVMFGWLILNNMHLNSVIADNARDQARIESQLGTALDLNKELNDTVVRLRVGQFVDEGIVLDNQAEIDRLRNEHDARVEEVRKQGPTGPADRAVICAITRVCDN